MEKIYMVTGATGFLGREVAQQLTAQQKKVIGSRMHKNGDYYFK